MHSQPEKREGRPRTGPADSKNLNSTTSVSAELRRRRDAANRCEPLTSGQRDPWERDVKPAGITVDRPARVFLVKGYGIRDVLRAAGMRPLFMASSRGHLLDLHRLPDAVAALEHAGYRVTTREGVA